jgi:hypothetical protein
LVAELLHGNVVQAAVQEQQLTRLHEGVVESHLRQVADSAAAGGAAGILSENAHASFGWEQESQQRFDGGGFSGAVDADEADAFSFVDGEGYVIHRPDVHAPGLVINGKMFNFLNG